MLSNYNRSAPETDYQLEYYNTIGLLFNKHLILNKNNKLVEFSIDEIKSISIKKERELNLNYIIFIIACSLFTIALYFTNNELLFQKIGILTSVGVLVYAVLKRNYAYKIVLFTQYSHLFTIPITAEIKDDAHELVTKTKLKVRTKKNYMQAS